MTFALAAGSLVLSSFFAFRSLSKSASTEYVEQLEKRVTACENDRVLLRQEVAELRDREVYLLSRLVKENR